MQVKYIYYWNSQLLNNVIISQSNVILRQVQAYVS
jgi:hypothetical protein